MLELYKLITAYLQDISGLLVFAGIGGSIICSFISPPFSDVAACKLQPSLKEFNLIGVLYMVATLLLLFFVIFDNIYFFFTGFCIIIVATSLFITYAIFNIIVE